MYTFKKIYINKHVDIYAAQPLPLRADFRVFLCEVLTQLLLYYTRLQKAMGRGDVFWCVLSSKTHGNRRGCGSKIRANWSIDK